VEVQPRHDPADELSAGAKVYLLPLPPGDPVLAALQARGWLAVHGGSAITSVVTLSPPAALAAVAPAAGQVMAAEAAWLAANARNNVLAPARVAISPPALAAWRSDLLEQRTHAGRLELAMALYVYALEATAPAEAHSLRGAVRGFGSLADFLGDDGCIGFVSDARQELLRRNLAALAPAAARLSADPATAKAFGAALGTLFDEYFTAA
jgi:hypothetical protein